MVVALRGAHGYILDQRVWNGTSTEIDRGGQHDNQTRPGVGDSSEQ